ncbi:hypothetical protein HDU92_004908 [Lobulomyces angularis]|nr:hypothetical protein HDU92_004908 [Lobulomyces angularis]
MSAFSTLTEGSTNIVLVDPTDPSASSTNDLLQPAQPTVTAPVSNTPFNNNVPTILTLPSDIIPGGSGAAFNSPTSVVNTQTFLPPLNSQTNTSNPNSLAPVTIACIIMVPLVLIILIIALIIYYRRMKKDNYNSKSPYEMSKIRKFNNSVRRVAKRNKGSTSRYSASPSDSELADNLKNRNMLLNKENIEPLSNNYNYPKTVPHSSYELDRESPDQSQSTYVDDFPKNRRGSLNGDKGEYNRDDYQDGRENHDRRDNFENRRWQDNNREIIQNENEKNRREIIYAAGMKNRGGGDTYSQRMSESEKLRRDSDFGLANGSNYEGSSRGDDMYKVRDSRRHPKELYGANNNYEDAQGDVYRAAGSRDYPLATSSNYEGAGRSDSYGVGVFTGRKEKEFEQHPSSPNRHRGYKSKASDVGSYNDSFKQRMSPGSSVNGDSFDPYSRSRLESHYSGSNNGDSYRERMGLRDDEVKLYNERYHHNRNTSETYDDGRAFENNHHHLDSDGEELMSVSSSNFSGARHNKRYKQILPPGKGKQNLSNLSGTKSQLSNKSLYNNERINERNIEQYQRGLNNNDKISNTLHISDKNKNDGVLYPLAQSETPISSGYDSGNDGISDYTSDCGSALPSKPKRGQKTKL